MVKSSTQEFGWTEVPRNRSNVPSEKEAKTSNVEVDFGTIWPKTSVVESATKYVKENLPKETFSHSLRVYCFGHTIVTQHFPSWIESNKASFFETWALTCLFHDIATTPTNRNNTHLSFEFQGGFIALQQLQSYGAPVAQAESVCEAIIRHQDPGETGTVSRMGQLVQISTEFDNMGYQPHLIHKDVISQVAKQHPRLNWSSCFSGTIKEEIAAKPWCHTTSLEGFAEAVEGNKLMHPYD
ncbi:hypothetical protein PRZ48_004512 [Zasmidium cellare]|uniref:HD domain-containing protein n=1 Tax=Zasmidium cellare TaxID=395010 RepID=A0ABR0EPQ4_ZASCE|nr:hypothetical protein PRZ48_004512 [Zasmidium cellare]